MKKHIIHKRGLSVLILIALIMIPSCGWFREDPMYVGIWQNKDKFYTEEFIFKTITTLKLTENTFEEVYIIQRDNSSAIISLLATKGAILVKDDEVTFTLNAVGECVRDAENLCTGSIQWFAKGSATYNSYVQYIRETVSGKFEAGEYYLRLFRDRNGDGDYEDEGEDIEFERY